MRLSKPFPASLKPRIYRFPAYRTNTGYFNNAAVPLQLAVQWGLALLLHQAVGRVPTAGDYGEKVLN
jgi:hypothetical protein